MKRPEVRDADIRHHLRRHLEAAFAPGGEPTRIVDELAICDGFARIDVAVINGALHGYEIKGPRDDLARLPQQQEFYSRAFDTVTLVTAECHAAAAADAVPRWWGILLARQDGRGVVLDEERPPRRNPSPDPFSVAQLLWRHEVLEELRAAGIHTTLSRQPKRALWWLLADALPLDHLARRVRERLKSRRDWRADLGSERCDGPFRSDAESSNFPGPPRRRRTQRSSHHLRSATVEKTPAR